MKFIKGRWYKLPNNSNFIAKFNGKMDYCSEYISNDYKNYSNTGGSCNFYNAIEVSIESIKHILPTNYKFENEEIEYEIY